jgi:hypothetical protein
MQLGHMKLDSVYRCHDLMIELDRIESAIQNILDDRTDRHGEDFARLEIERARIDNQLRVVREA